MYAAILEGAAELALGTMTFVGRRSHPAAAPGTVRSPDRFPVRPLLRQLPDVVGDTRDAR